MDSSSAARRGRSLVVTRKLEQIEVYYNANGGNWLGQLLKAMSSMVQINFDKDSTIQHRKDITQNYLEFIANQEFHPVAKSDVAFSAVLAFAELFGVYVDEMNERMTSMPAKAESLRDTSGVAGVKRRAPSAPPSITEGPFTTKRTADKQVAEQKEVATPLRSSTRLRRTTARLDEVPTTPVAAPVVAKREAVEDEDALSQPSTSKRARGVKKVVATTPPTVPRYRHSGVDNPHPAVAQPLVKSPSIPESCAPPAKVSWNAKRVYLPESCAPPPKDSSNAVVAPKVKRLSLPEPAVVAPPKVSPKAVVALPKETAVVAPPPPPKATATKRRSSGEADFDSPPSSVVACAVCGERVKAGVLKRHLKGHAPEEVQRAEKEAARSADSTLDGTLLETSMEMCAGSVADGDGEEQAVKTLAPSADSTLDESALLSSRSNESLLETSLEVGAGSLADEDELKAMMEDVEDGESVKTAIELSLNEFGLEEEAADDSEMAVGEQGGEEMADGSFDEWVDRFHKPAACFQCDKMCPNYQAISRHLYLQHKKELGGFVFQCLGCSKPFRSLSGATGHVRAAFSAKKVGCKNKMAYVGAAGAKENSVAVVPEGSGEAKKKKKEPIAPTL